MAPRKDLEHYWQDRLAERNERLLGLRNSETKRLLRELYEDQSTKLQAAITQVFLKILSDQAENDGKIYANDLYRTNTYHVLLNYFNECAKAIGGKQVLITEQALIDMYDKAQETVEQYVPQALKPTTLFLLPRAVDTKQAIHQAWVLDGKEFSDRIWENKKALVQDLSRTLADFCARGESPYRIAQGIEERLKVDEYCAFRIARTETAHASIKGQVDKYKSYGITHGVFRSVDPCGLCNEHDGKEYTLEQIETLIPKHPNCECSFDVVVGR